MQLEGSELLPASPEELWEILFDPDVIAATIPGCEDLRQIGEDRYEGRVRMSVGPFTQVFDAVFTVTDREYASSYRLVVEATGKGAAVTADTAIRLEAAAPGQTLLRYESTATLGGGLAGLGFLGESVARMVVAQGLEDFKKRIDERLAS